MMLTRCPYCGTTFRVTPEQLKIREGQVRCGKCRRVFDALRALVEEQPQRAPPPPPPAAAPEPAPATHAELSWTFVQPAPPGADPEEHEPITITGFTFVPTRSPEPVTITPPEEPTGFSSLAEAEARPAPEPELPAPEPSPSAAEDAPFVPTEPPIEPGPAEEAVEVITIEAPLEPEFEMEVEPEEPLAAEPAIDERREPEVPANFTDPADEIVIKPLPEPVAEPEQLPHFDPGPPTIFDLHVEESRSTLRWPWVLGSLLAVVVLVGQLLLHYRTEIIARQPDTRPLFLAACDALGCEIALPRDINLISIDSSDLSPNAAQPGTLHLTATLRNRATVAQTWPHLEVTLTNAQERPLLRRALAPEEYLPPDVVPAEGFPARSEQVLQLSLTAKDVPAVGYRLYIFHP